MRYQRIYDAWMKIYPWGRKQRPNAVSGVFEEPGLRERTLDALSAACCIGASVCAVRAGKPIGVLCTGSGGACGDVTPDTRFRVASVSKMVTASIAVRLAAEGRISLDGEAGEMLGTALRNPHFPDIPLTLRMLLSHTSSLTDGEVFSLPEKELREAAADFRWLDAAPGSRFCYSNLGAALAGAVLEAACGEDLDALLRDTWDTGGSYWPQRLPSKEKLADQTELFPWPAVRYRAAQVRSRELPEEGPCPGAHWRVAHGNLCLNAEEAARIMDGILRRGDLRGMSRPHAAFGKRDPMITEGLGLFLIRLSDGKTLLGHQGLAYGACHGVFGDPESGISLALLTAGCSVSRRYVLTELNLKMLEILRGMGETCAEK